MSGEVLHGFEHESTAAKLAWFRTLSIGDRLRALDDFYRLAVALNPRLRGGTDAGEPATSVRVLELPRS